MPALSAGLQRAWRPFPLRRVALLSRQPKKSPGPQRLGVPSWDAVIRQGLPGPGQKLGADQDRSAEWAWAQVEWGLTRPSLRSSEATGSTVVPEGVPWARPWWVGRTKGACRQTPRCHPLRAVESQPAGLRPPWRLPRPARPIRDLLGIPESRHCLQMKRQPGRPRLDEVSRMVPLAPSELRRQLHRDQALGSAIPQLSWVIRLPAEALWKSAPATRSGEQKPPH